MRIVVISDTHGGHEELGVLEGDVLIHCGDLEGPGSPGWIDRVDDWFGRQRFELILCIGGNHDFELEQRVRRDDQPFMNAIWLHDRALSHRGRTFYGSSWVPDLSGFAFYGNETTLAAAWAAIPEDVDVLITHTPPRGILDVSSIGLVLGCDLLAQRLAGLSPALHCFGHVHRSSGQVTQGPTTFVNAAVVNSQFDVVRGPTVLDLAEGRA